MPPSHKSIQQAGNKKSFKQFCEALGSTGDIPTFLLTWPYGFERSAPYYVKGSGGKLVPQGVSKLSPWLIDFVRSVGAGQHPGLYVVWKSLTEMHVRAGEQSNFALQNAIEKFFMHLEGARDIHGRERKFTLPQLKLVANRIQSAASALSIELQQAAKKLSYPVEIKAALDEAGLEHDIADKLLGFARACERIDGIAEPFGPFDFGYNLVKFGSKNADRNYFILTLSWWFYGVSGRFHDASVSALARAAFNDQDITDSDVGKVRRNARRYKRRPAGRIVWGTALGTNGELQVFSPNMPPPEKTFYSPKRKIPKNKK